MRIRSLASILIVASSFVLVHGQTPETNKEGPDKATKTSDVRRIERLRDMPFGATGIDLQFLVKELARDMDLNVLFDVESFRSPGRKVYIDLKNVTAAEALDYVLLQEGLIYDEVGPKTILVAIRARGTWVPQLGVGVTLIDGQLAQYFGVDRGALINNVRPDSPGSKAGLKAGDVILAIDGQPVRNAVGAMSVIDAKKEGDLTLRVVRDHKEQTITLTRPNLAQ